MCRKRTGKYPEGSRLTLNRKIAYSENLKYLGINSEFTHELQFSKMVTKTLWLTS